MVLEIICHHFLLVLMSQYNPYVGVETMDIILSPLRIVPDVEELRVGVSTTDVRES